MASLSPARADVSHVWIPAARVCWALYLGMPCRWPLGKARYLGGLSTLAWHGGFSPTSLEHQGGHKCSHLCQPFPSLCTAVMRPNRPKQFWLQFWVYIYIYNNTKHSGHELQRQDLSFHYFSKSVHGQFKGCQGNRIYRKNLGLTRAISQNSHT